MGNAYFSLIVAPVRTLFVELGLGVTVLGVEGVVSCVLARSLSSGWPSCRLRMDHKVPAAPLQCQRAPLLNENVTVSINKDAKPIAYAVNVIFHQCLSTFISDF
ncbi:hypothetical protein RB195_011246 [Necator americanus]|uniref:Uncharacterized protein n=1 Tax=Necator americanus TaxID=51031 RepID=A0ABR1D2R5_NECAM